MADIFISYARSTEAQAHQIAVLLRGLGYAVWRDDDLPAHRAYAEVIEERLRAAKAVVVVWSADGAKSQWVRAEADLAREAGTLVQLSLDGATPPLPFNQIQCADMNGWRGDAGAPGWQKVLASIAELMGAPAPAAPGPAASPPLQRPPTHAARAVVAVPLLSDLTGPGEPDHFAEGLREDIVAALSRHSTLLVLRQASDAADYVVEAQVRRSGGRVRILVRLVVAGDGDQLWSERFDGAADDVFDLQDRITEGVSASVEANIRRHRIERAFRGATTGDDSEGLYLRAAMYVNLMEKAAYFEAVTLLDQVIEANPRHAHALAMASLARFNIWMNGYPEATDSNREIGIDCAKRSLSISDTDGFSAGMAAMSLAHLGEPVEASRALIDRVIALNAGYPPALFWSGQIRLIAGDLEGALEHLEAASRLDPRMTVRPALLGSMGAALMLQGRLDDACTKLLEATQLSAQMQIANLFLASTYGHMGRIDDARAILAKAETVAPTEGFRLPLRNPEQRQMFAEGLARARG